MRANSHKIIAFAERLTKIQDDAKEDIDALALEVKAADIDMGGLRRLVAWQRKDRGKRAEQEAIDHQYRFLAGDEAEPAPLPVPSELATAVDLYGRGGKVRDVAAAMKVSVGKAQKLRTMAQLFLVHVRVNVNAPRTFEEAAEPISGVTSYMRGEPSHDPGTGEIKSATTGASDAPVNGNTVAYDPSVPHTLTESCGGVESRHAQPPAIVAGDDQRPSPLTEPREHVGAGVAPGPQDLDLTIPPFLKRVAA